MRDKLAAVVAPLLRWTGSRFPKAYRTDDTRRHRAVRAVLNTTRANQIADGNAKK